MIEVGDLVKIKNGSGFIGNEAMPRLSHERGVWLVLKTSNRVGTSKAVRALIMKGSKQRSIYINRLEKL
ncbi:MAG: hypothetical protein CMI27_02635 [Opitutae bacterium]|nr:hypothetical protein [Opitutae bacterium]